jgi:hypothetical protein
MGMIGAWDRVVSLFKEALTKIEARESGKPNAWERFVFCEALIAIEAGDMDAAERELLRIGATPEVSDLEAVWKAPRLTLDEIAEHIHRVQ